MVNGKGSSAICKSRRFNKKDKIQITAVTRKCINKEVMFVSTSTSKTTQISYAS
ncbi:Hypothetical predicted protein [Mytilus galloprovincialis]|uniref:Uncharacterized protein n=1 Tax=Mytilus galloprovincialis TaxID=29158 RepID=A0A8B6H6M0_MYTGA|nr:Hypothetical predicted protein [Mytilus galloprovincialis]